MSRADLDWAVGWAAKEGWNPGLYDADCFYAADPEGFLMGFLGEEAIASISVVKYGESFGFLGFYIVKPEFRGQGYGLQIWQAGLAALEGRIVGLDGVVAQQSNYLRSGFKLAYRNIRYEGIQQSDETVNSSRHIVPLATLPMADLLQYDRPLFPGDRAQFLRCWLTQPESYGVGYLRDDILNGYGLLRRCRQGFKIGPLFADNAPAAEAIFQSLKARVPRGNPFYLDVPQVNEAAVALAHRHGLKSMFETARMYAPSLPELPTDRIFGVTSFELG